MIVFTNDEATVNALARASKELDAWAWSEALHVGPVGKTYDLDTFARDRALVFQYHGWDESLEAESDFALRNDALRRALAGGREIVLLFGSGIRDQLALARLATWLNTQAKDALDRVRISVSEHNLASETDEALGDRALRAEVPDRGRLNEYESVWTSFVSDDPTGLGKCCRSLEGGPLKTAAHRLLREFPSSDNGLSLTECQILDAISLGANEPLVLFEACKETESSPFLSDWEFWAVLERMTLGASPLIEIVDRDTFLCPPKALSCKIFQEQRFVLTAFGERVLKGEQHYGSADFQDRWIGGAHLSKNRLWFWDYRNNRLTREPGVPSVS